MVSLLCHWHLRRRLTTYEGALHAVSVLYRVVVVVPRRSVLSGIEGIIERVARCDWTLSDAIDAIHMHIAKLPNSMPMDACTVVRQVIDDMNVDPLNEYCEPLISDELEFTSALTSPQQA